ncbi:type I restriction-modification system subunit M [Hydromonas duriensis]|uniref:site-specific DNA-methyltransferase (adenine-specific) n=1 Tax=Hydromonas duriensis TaxID=1527608 RepID=A0A4R6Y759_9BURK|nr:class I SAM-dependent DNA methyltransferase [Hydromonas duriensis]TDR31053.1 type I restriction enzyme M protein [Hydromonas duriensis]
MITGEIKSQVDRIWEAFWTGGISNPLTVIEQFTYLLFLRRLDEVQLREEAKINLIGGELKNPSYTPEQAIFRWSKFSELDPESMFALFTQPQAKIDNLTVFEHMKQLGERKKEADSPEVGIFAQFMQGATFMIQTPRLLDQVVQMIAAIKMDDRDTKGDLYEYLLSKIATAKLNGQFRTPRHIIRMMVEMMQPTQTDTICDPSCGSAGFLVGAGEYIHTHHKDWFHDKTFNAHYNQDMFTGIEFDQTMLRIGAMNLQLHGIESPKLIAKDALSEANADQRELYSLILANPPFKGSLDYDSVESSLLNTVKTKKTELLFLALILRMLKIGGRCAVIVPDGVLFGAFNAHKQLREQLLAHNKLDAVISMPSGVFKPYAGVSTAVLIFTKTGSADTDNVWFYDMQADGYSLDDKRAVVSEDNIPDIISRFKTRLDANSAEVTRTRTEQSFFVPYAEIKANDWDLSINRYRQVVYETVEHAKPADIIAQIEKLDAERTQALTVLKGLLNA